MRRYKLFTNRNRRLLAFGSNILHSFLLDLKLRASRGTQGRKDVLSGATALEILDSQIPIELALVDYAMPRMVWHTIHALGKSAAPAWRQCT
jgi:CheY-like chemotaxis protein